MTLFLHPYFWTGNEETWRIGWLRCKTHPKLRCTVTWKWWLQRLVHFPFQESTASNSRPFVAFLCFCCVAFYGLFLNVLSGKIEAVAKDEDFPTKNRSHVMFSSCFARVVFHQALFVETIHMKRNCHFVKSCEKKGGSCTLIFLAGSYLQKESPKIQILWMEELQHH